MSTILHSVRSIDESQLQQAIRSEAGAHAIQSVVAAVRFVFEGLFNGLAAYRRFEHLRSWGVPQDTALREALCQRSKDRHQQHGSGISH